MKPRLLVIFMAALCCLGLWGCGEDYYSLPQYDNEKSADLTAGITQEERDTYDEVLVTEVAVVGSDPEGVAAAVSAARNGMDTMLIDFGRDKVGGLYTLGWLNMIDLNYDTKGGSTSINQGIFGEVLEANGNKTSFTIDEMEGIFNDLLTEAEVTTKIDYDDDFEVIQENGTITGLVVSEEGKTTLIKAAEFIDSTQNADLAIAAGAQYYDGLEELGLTGERGCDTLVFQLSGVDWDEVKDFLNDDDNDNTGADNASAWGYSEITQCEISNDNIYMRGPNIGLQEDGTILLNGLQVFHMDIHDEGAMEAMREDIITVLETELIPFMRENFQGWENAELVSVAPEFYIRESYHIKTMERLVGEDIFQSNFSDSFIACGSYSIDLQARSKGLYGIALYGTSPYGIPFGAMVTEEVSNLLVASKCSGYDAIAAGSARTVPVGMSVGQAAGAAAAYAIVNDTEDFRTIVGNSEATANIRSLLNSQEANLVVREQTDLQKATAASPYYEEIKYLRGKGILTCGYTNDYNLTEAADRETLNGIQYAMSSNSPYYIPSIDVTVLPEDKEFEAGDILIILNAFLSREETDLGAYVTDGVLTQEIANDIEAADTVTNELFYGAMGDMVQYMEAAGNEYYTDTYKAQAETTTESE